MAIDIKFSKFDNTPWGFRLAGGSDFPQPLTVIRVTERSLAECMGLRVGDVVVRLNDEPITGLTHGKAHETLVLAGNNFVLGVLRGEESEKAIEAIREENIVPYTIPLEELPPVYPEELLTQETPEPAFESEQSETPQPSENLDTEEEVFDKPTDANSEIVPNRNLTDDEIAQLILEEEELLPDQGVLGVNFKKLRPRAPLIKDSKVFEELQSIETADPPQIQELKRFTTFLQKPQRPVPSTKAEVEEPKGESYKVVIQKQHKKSVTERLLERGLLEPSKTPEPRSENATPAATPEPPVQTEEISRPDSKAEEIPEVADSSDEREADETPEREPQEEPTVEEPAEEDPVPEEDLEEAKISMPKFDAEKMKQLVSTEISLEKQLESVQNQLLALKQLPSEIENHLRIVSEQLYKIMELSGVQNGDTNKNSRRESEQSQNSEENEERRDDQNEDERNSDDQEQRECNDQADQDETVDARPDPITTKDGEIPQIIEPEEDDPQEKKEVEIKVKSEDDTGKRVKKFIVSYESKVLKSRTPSPAFSDRDIFEPDPNLAPKDQVIQELQQNRGRKHSHDLWPQAKQLELTFGRRWRCPNDFFNDEMIADILSSQAEVIRGRALGINFKKYEKTNLPNYDHLMDSSVYKMVHKMEREPKKGIPVRPAKVNAVEDILERVKSPALSIADDRSARSISH